MTEYTVENILECFGRKTDNFPVYAVVYEDKAVVMCYKKINAELIAEILNADLKQENFLLSGNNFTVLSKAIEQASTRIIGSTAHEAYMIAVNKRLEKAFVDDHIISDGVIKRWKEFSENDYKKETGIDATR